MKTNTDQSIELTIDQYVPQKELVTSYIALDGLTLAPQAQTAAKINMLEQATGGRFSNHLKSNMSNLASQGVRPVMRNRAATVAVSQPLVRGDAVESIDAHMDQQFAL